MLLVGSRALREVAPQLLDREPADWDLVATHEEAQAFLRAHRGLFQSVEPSGGGRYVVGRGSGVTCEVEVAWEGTSAAALLRLDEPRCEGDHCQFSLSNEVPPFFAATPSLDLLYALKHSHRFLRDSPHFLKTMGDWRRMRAAGAQILPEHRDWLRQRERETYAYSHPSLDRSKADFFRDDGVGYVYDHDSVHEALKHGEAPAYKSFIRPGCEVRCDRALFDAAPERVRLWSVVEEAYVLAVERSQVPYPGRWTPRRSFEHALMKVCTSITSGWWREYAYEHYWDAAALYDDTYADRFWAAVKSGVVRSL